MESKSFCRLYILPIIFDSLRPFGAGLYRSFRRDRGNGRARLRKKAKPSEEALSAAMTLKDESQEESRKTIVAST